jgi:hypothetical protein
VLLFKKQHIFQKNKNMTTEELLIPRFKIVKEKEILPYKIGEIVNTNDIVRFTKDALCICVLIHISDSFQALCWYEHRNEDELSKYVKEIGTDTIYKVLKYTDNNACVRLLEENIEITTMTDYVTPSTYEDYSNYTENEKIKNLLKRRVILQKDFFVKFYTTATKGTIFIENKLEDCYLTKDKRCGFLSKTIHNRTKLFTELQWYEYRTIEEMPDYVKIKGTDVIENVYWLASNTSCCLVRNGSIILQSMNLEPATKEQYLNHENN